jgi:hypothetical protein
MEPFISLTQRPIALYCGFLLQMGLPFFGNDFVIALLKNESNERPYICTDARTIHNVVKVPSFLSVFRMDDGQYL